VRTNAARPVLGVFAALALASAVRAQGSDDCATPQAIHGTGAFRFDTRAATTGGQGQGAGACLALGTAGIDRDVWFAWTAPLDADFSLATCGRTELDTKIALYAGSGCPSGLPLACNDDACGYQSRIDFHASAGSAYTIQLGSFPGAAGDAGTFSIDTLPSLPDCQTGSGPDLVLGDIVNVFNATAEGPIDALAIGGAACNVGTAPVDWDGSVGASPVIRQNLFRYKIVDGAGRFEQVGMSWLKHGFFAVQESFCCTCQAEAGNARLGVGCTDIYVAGFNAAQMYLTPNWEVNAHTGVFPHPASDPPWSGTVARRLQVELADLETTGGASGTRYFAEGLYVARDDARAGNQNDNASWREMSVAGGPSDFTLDLLPGSHTERARAAIEAWRKIDPAVRCAEIQIPGDGRLILCWRVTPLAGSMWRYEYALYNMNSDRDVGSFALPLPTGMPLANVEFHVPRYHSGDGPGDVDFSHADWQLTTIFGTVAWTTETEAQNPSANALRWGTLANFRFDAPRPPRTVTATIGLWKSGSPNAVHVEIDGPRDFSVESFCAGDGGIQPCPCGNSGIARHGCENSASTGGAMLTWTGEPTLASDDLVLTSSGETSSALSIVMQVDVEVLATFYGDGLRCFGGTARRLYVEHANGGTVVAPGPGDPSISARSAALGVPIQPNDSRIYQIVYRDPTASFCPPPLGGSFNASNGLRVLWGM